MNHEKEMWQLVHENERLRDEIALLRLTEEERNAVKEVADSYYENCCNEDCLAVARILRGILENKYYERT